MIITVLLLAIGALVEEAKKAVGHIPGLLADPGTFCEVHPGIWREFTRFYSGMPSERVHIQN